MLRTLDFILKVRGVSSLKQQKGDMIDHLFSVKNGLD